MKSETSVKTEAAPVQVGSIVEAQHYQSGQWRKAKVTKITPANDNVGLGYYVQWLDTDPKNYAQSQSAWVNAASIRTPIPPVQVAQHTPTPWTVIDAEVWSTGPHWCIADCYTEHSQGNPKASEANAEFIARACNCHEELVEALQAILSTCQDGVIQRNVTGKPQWSALDHMGNIARAALAKASIK